MSEALDRILEALQAAGLPPDAEGTRDALWLSLQIAEREGQSTEVPKLPSHQDITRLTQPPEHPEETSKKSEKAPPGPAAATKAEPAGDSVHRLLRLSVPAPLPGSRTLGQALRPLRRRVPSPAGYCLDLGETIRQAAEEDVWFPVLSKQSERWLSLALVVERSISMSVFHESVRELRRTFRYSGAFRELRVWWLDAEGENARVYARHRDAVRGTGARRLGEVPGSGRRTLVLVLSDCVSDGWYNGKILSVLALWSRNTPVALLQVLPERIWPRTALGMASRVRLYASVELQTNSRLRWTAELPDSWDIAEGGGFLLPSASLDPAALHSLSQLVAGGGSGWIPGFNFLSEQNEQVAAPHDLAALGADERVRRFIAVSSALAVKLATFLAVSPIISMGVLRLLRRELLPEAGSVQEAEVLLGGLLRVRRADQTEATGSEEIQIDFPQGVRSLLRDNASTGDVLRVVERAVRFAQSSEFDAAFIERLLVDPEAAAGQLDPESGPLAKEVAQLLRRLGGVYSLVAYGQSAKKSKDNRREIGQRRSKLFRSRKAAMNKATILLADNDKASLRAWRRVLQEAEYETVQSSSVETTAKYLDMGGFDLAIIDLDMKNDDDESDDSGLMLAEAYGEKVPIIILSGRPAVGAALRALRGGGRRSAPAVDFLNKIDGAEGLLRAVRKAIKPKIFLSHGHDEAVTVEVVRFLEGSNTRVVLLRDQPGRGRGPLELLEDYRNIEFAIILVTPDDLGCKKGDELKLLRPRARQNVIFELGFFLAKLGRGRVLVLYKDEGEPIEWPSNFQGVLYREIDHGGGWRDEVRRDLIAAGIELG